MRFDHQVWCDHSLGSVKMSIASQVPKSAKTVNRDGERPEN